MGPRDDEEPQLEAQRDELCQSSGFRTFARHE